MLKNKSLNSREEREKSHFNDMAIQKGYDWWGYNTPAAKLRFEKRIDLIDKNIILTSGMKVLECGCGAGEFTFYLSSFLNKKNILFSAIELSNHQINIAKERVNQNVDFVTGSLTNMPFKENTFDVIVGNSILHHLDLNKALPEIKRVLKPNGTIVFFEPNLLNPIGWLLFNVKPLRKLHQASPDEMAFYKNDLKDQLEKNCFNDITVEAFDFMFPLFPKALFKLVNKFEQLIKPTLINEIGGSLFITAKK